MSVCECVCVCVCGEELNHQHDNTKSNKLENQNRIRLIQHTGMGEEILSYILNSFFFCFDKEATSTTMETLTRITHWNITGTTTNKQQ